MPETATIKSKLLKFVDRRNKSEHASNLQFQIDLEGSGMKIADIGPALRLPDGSGYQWFIPIEDGPELRLIEQHGSMRLK